MTAQPDHWASTDHDPTSHTEGLRRLSLISAQPLPPTGPDIDELAVLQVAHDGLRLHLRGADRDEAVRRMHGRIDMDLIAWRLHTTTRTVQRVAARLGLTEHKIAGTHRSASAFSSAVPATRRRRATA
ncbi:hypothetical protein MSIMFB_04484 [Mycobacterium simulans]|uniref:Uncharacterized protein n=1 Tax=Mycobacterium simulans TaxID=627089 RepID=A0A7Z7NCD7_9MYCO|nr:MULTISPECIES: hypothetical protein [Mycobacterium]SOJ57006.1 hypothetical protein MSIMFB_04484 [Mycobacterium simulans]